MDNKVNNVRYYIIFAIFALLFIVLEFKLFWFAFQDDNIGLENSFTSDKVIFRPDIVDRNGKLVASDIQSYSLFAQPNRIINIDETANLLHKVLRHLSTRLIISRLSHKQSFVWIARNLTSEQKNSIKLLGLPGIGFRMERRRFYPAGSDMAYIVGYVDVDNKGLSGLEKYIDDNLLDQEQSQDTFDPKYLDSIKLSVDVRAQAVVTKILKDSIDKYKAKAAGALIMDVTNGEVLAMNSLPDFDPSNPRQSLETDRINRMSAGLYEMGSVIKVFTTAMVLDTKKFNLNSIFDATEPLKVGPGQYIHDFHGKKRPLTLSEVFIYSSNIGSAKEAAAIGLEKHKEFLQNIGLLSKCITELPEVAKPVYPKKWRSVNSMTIAFGHGLMVTPLQVAAGASAIVNGGYLYNPTFLLGTKQSPKKVVSESTSNDMVYLLGLNMQKGSGRYANEKYYNIGGKTGTAEKVENGKYSKDKSFNSFLAVFPVNKPRYIVLTVIDEPHPADKTVGDTAGYNAAPMAVEIINRCANFFKVKPNS